VSERCLETLQRLRELPWERHGELEEHLAACGDCRAMAVRLRATAGSPAPLETGGPLKPLPLRVAASRSPDKNPLLMLLGILAGVGVALGLIAPRFLDAYRAATYRAPELPGGIDPTVVWGAAGPPRSPVLEFSIRQRQLGEMVAAPALVGPRASVWAAVTCGEPATVSVCVAGPQGDERLWTPSSAGATYPTPGTGSRRRAGTRSASRWGRAAAPPWTAPGSTSRPDASQAWIRRPRAPSARGPPAPRLPRPLPFGGRMAPTDRDRARGRRWDRVDRLGLRHPRSAVRMTRSATGRPEGAPRDVRRSDYPGENMNG